MLLWEDSSKLFNYLKYSNSKTYFKKASWLVRFRIIKIIIKITYLIKNSKMEFITEPHNCERY